MQQYRLTELSMLFTVLERIHDDTMNKHLLSALVEINVLNQLLLYRMAGVYKS